MFVKNYICLWGSRGALARGVRRLQRGSDGGVAPGNAHYLVHEAGSRLPEAAGVGILLAFSVLLSFGFGVVGATRSVVGVFALPMNSSDINHRLHYLGAPRKNGDVGMEGRKVESLKSLVLWLALAVLKEIFP